VLGLCAGAGLVLLWSALVGGRILAPGDLVYDNVPFSAVRPAGLTHAANAGLADLVYIFEPLLLHAREAVRAGHLPIWDPATAAGRPLGAEQGAPLFPLSGLAYVFPFWHSLAWIALAKLVLAGSGAFLLARHFGLRRGPAALAALAFPFSSVFVAFLGQSQTDVAALIPWTLLAADRLAQGGGVRDACLLALALGLGLYGGHPETWFVGVCGAVAITLARGWERRRLPVGPTALAVGLTALVGGLYAIPFLELLAHGTHVTRGGSHPDSLRQLTVGALFPEWWGRTDKTTYDAAHANLLTASSVFPGRAYMGVVPLLAIAASTGLRWRRAMRFFALLAALSLAVMIDVPGLRAIVAHVPPLSRMNPHFFIWLLALSVAMLGAFGLDAVLRAPAAAQRRALRRAALFAAAVTLVALALNVHLLGHLGGALRQLPAQRHDAGSAANAAAGALLRWALVCAVALLAGVVALRSGRNHLRPPVVAGVALVLLLVVDLVTIDHGYNPALPVARAVPPAPPALAAAAASSPLARVAGPLDAANPAVVTRYGLADARVNDQPQVERYARTFAALGGFVDFAQGESLVGAEPAYGETGAQVPGARTRALLNLLGARYVVDAGGAAPAVGVRVAYAAPGARLLVDSAALPRAWVAYAWRPAAGLDAALRAVATSSVAALRARPVIEGATGSGESPGPPSAPATVLAASDDALTVRAQLARAGWVVVDDLFYPGWGATVDARPATIHPADGMLRAIAVPAGTHVIRLRYRPASVRAGAVLTLAGLLACAAGLLLGSRWLRR
jgi:hypothetical protein